MHVYGKICSIADVYDALTTDRPYRRITAFRGVADYEGTDDAPFPEGSVRTVCPDACGEEELIISSPILPINPSD